MARPVTLVTGQWADMPLDELAELMCELGYDGLELACWGDHFDVEAALSTDGYIQSRWDILEKYQLGCYAISNHLVGQCVCDKIDERHQSILPPSVWGDGNPEKVQERAAETMKHTAQAARLMFDGAPDEVKALCMRPVVNGFTGSSIWPKLYSFPPMLPGTIDAGYKDFADRWLPILDAFEAVNVDFALEVHPTEIAFDTVSAQRALSAVNGHKRFGFNYDPSHLGYQGVDYVGFIRAFAERIYHVHMKDVYWSSNPCGSGVFGGHLDFGDYRRFWNFRSLGRGSVDFEEIIRALNDIDYGGPLSVEWEDAGMDRVQGAEEACEFVQNVDFQPSEIVFDAAFEKK